MIVWSSAPWSARLVPSSATAGYTEVRRAVLELIAEVAPLSVESKRVILEAIHPVGYVTPTANVLVPRYTAEVLGLAKEYVGRFGVASRVTLEAIGSFAQAHRGFKVPEVVADAVSIAYSIELDTSGPGYFGLVDEDSFGYSLSWDTATPFFIVETWRVGTNIVQSTFTRPTGRFVRSFVLPNGFGEINLTDLGTTRPAGKDKLGSLQEIIVWNRGLSDSERDEVEDYLRCKWVPDMCGVVDFYEQFYEGLTPYAFSSEIPITPDMLSTFEINVDSSGNPRLQVSHRQNAGRINMRRSMPAQEYTQASFQFRIINTSNANAGYIQIGGSAGRAIAVVPRVDLGFDISRRAVVYIGSAGPVFIGTSQLVNGELYEFRIVQTGPTSGNWTLLRYVTGGDLITVQTGSGTLNWNWSELSFVGDNNNYPGGMWVVYDDIYARGALPPPPPEPPPP